MDNVPIIQANESGIQAIRALVDIARKVIPLQEVPSLLMLLNSVKPIPKDELEKSAKVVKFPASKKKQVAGDDGPKEGTDVR
jgi:hypothetical protein